jgi:hypothetical protein
VIWARACPAVPAPPPCSTGRGLGERTSPRTTRSYPHLVSLAHPCRHPATSRPVHSACPPSGLLCNAARSSSCCAACAASNSGGRREEAVQARWRMPLRLSHLFSNPAPLGPRADSKAIQWEPAWIPRPLRNESPFPTWEGGWGVGRYRSLNVPLARASSVCWAWCPLRVT